jgi:recombination DNA repair RAD52 pathway protein
MTELSSAQRETLLKPLKPKRVLRDNKGMSHLPAFDVVAHLTRIFGFEGWDKSIVNLHMVSEQLEDYTKDNQPRQGWTVTYACMMRLTIKVPDEFGNWETVKTIEDGATGSAHHMPLRGDAHDFAMKNAISYAIKRCAKDLGDQFGLSLYNKGDTSALVQQVVPYQLITDGQEPETDVPTPRGLGNDERDQELQDE